MSNMDLGFLKQAINETKKSMDETRKAINHNTNELHLANLINLVNLGLISKEDVMNDSVYQLYRESLFVGEKVGKKSLVK